jgi:flagellin
MAMVVNNNIPALVSYNALTATSNSLQKSIQKLSSGLRINSAADDAAGLAISEKMRAQIRGLDRAVSNSQDGISMIQTAEGALSETHSILQRMRELSVQAANDTLTQQDRGYIQLEIDALREEVTRIGNTTQFNKKKLLDGSAAVLWSSDKLSTKAIINGGLRVVDQFGQKNAAEGNYKISITATPGDAEAQKTNIFRLKHNVGEITFGTAAAPFPVGVASGARSDVMSTAPVVTGNGTAAPVSDADLAGLVSSVTSGNWSLTFTYTAADGSNVDITGTHLSTSGVETAISLTGIDLTNPANLTQTIAGVGTLVLSAPTVLGIAAGEKFSIFASNAGDADYAIAVKTSAGPTLTYNFNSTQVKGVDKNLIFYDAAGAAITTVAHVPANLGVVGDIAYSSTKLRDLQQFWNSEGRFLLEDPKTLTITQGNGRQTSITLYGDDTVSTMVKKLDDAIGVGLGQGAYASGFVTFSNPVTAGAGATQGTIVIRSAVPGADGRISLSGDEDVIKGLGLSTLQKATESTYDVTITNAHTDAPVARATVTGNKLIGLIHPNIDVIFNSMMGIKANAAYNANGFFAYTTTATDTFLHLADNTTVYQIGANEGEDMGVNIGDMRSEALGLNSVLVTDRESAARSITVIDNAIDKVSMQRAKLGAYQNRLEHTITNLTVAGENLTAAESRIRDTDMAKEMMNFTKLQIMLQAGTSMLAQANALPQNVLSLLR